MCRIPYVLSLINYHSFSSVEPECCIDTEMDWLEFWSTIVSVRVWVTAISIPTATSFTHHSSCCVSDQLSLNLSAKHGFISTRDIVADVLLALVFVPVKPSPFGFSQWDSNISIFFLLRRLLPFDDHNVAESISVRVEHLKEIKDAFATRCRLKDWTEDFKSVYFTSA